MTRPPVILRGGQLGILELILTGLLGPVDGYVLPGEVREGWPAHPRLRVPEPATTGRMILADVDNTPLATLDVRETLAADEGGCWVAGPLQPGRAAEHGIARGRRLSVGALADAERVALIGGRFGPADAVRLERLAAGGALTVVVVGPAEGADAAALWADVETWAEVAGGVPVFYLPQADLDGGDAALTVLASAEVIDLRVPPARDRRGAVVLFTGLSGAGKSTIARALAARITAQGLHRPVLLDGDHIRQELSSELGFDVAGRDRNLQRIAWVAARVAEGGGLAVCAPIAPFASSREAMRAKVEPDSPFVTVYVSTPLAVAEERDRKGLYAKARAGLISDFTGIDSPYEAPVDADLELDTSMMSVDECVARTLEMLQRFEILSDSLSDAYE